MSVITAFYFKEEERVRSINNKLIFFCQKIMGEVMGVLKIDPVNLSFTLFIVAKYIVAFVWFRGMRSTFIMIQQYVEIYFSVSM